MKRIPIILVTLLLLCGCTEKPSQPSETIAENQIQDSVIVQEETIDISKDDHLIEEDETIIPSIEERPAVEITPTPIPSEIPVVNNNPIPTKEPEKTLAPVETIQPTVKPTPEVVLTPEPTIEPTPMPTPIPTPIPTPVPTPVSTPEPPKQACPGGYNPDWDCGVRIDKATPIKLFSVADYGSVEAAFAACDVDGQSTTEYYGVEVRSYGCSQQTRNDYGIWGFAIYYMDVNGDVIY